MQEWYLPGYGLESSGKIDNPPLLDLSESTILKVHSRPPSPPQIPTTPNDSKKRFAPNRHVARMTNRCNIPPNRPKRDHLVKKHWAKVTAFSMRDENRDEFKTQLDLWTKTLRLAPESLDPKVNNMVSSPLVTVNPSNPLPSLFLFFFFF